MINLNYENFNELSSEISMYENKYTKADYKVLYKEIEKCTYNVTIGKYEDWADIHNILGNLNDIVIAIVDRDPHIGDLESNQKLIDENVGDSGDTYENIIGIMDTILDQTLCIEPYCESEHFEIIEQYKEQAYQIIQDTIAYIKDSGYSECCDDIFYRWATIKYDKVVKIVYRDASWDEDDIETVVCTSFKEFQDFIRAEYHNYVRNKQYGHEGLSPTIFNITFCSKLYEKTPKLKVDLKNVGFTDLAIEDFATTTLLTYLAENWNDVINGDNIIKDTECSHKKDIEYAEDEKLLKNVCIYEMMNISDKSGENNKMTLEEFKMSNSLTNI
jgi:hypothetical protein